MENSNNNKIKELEGIVGRKQIMIDYLEKMMDIAKEELDIDIKKTSASHNQLVQRKQRKKEFFYEQVIYHHWHQHTTSCMVI